LATLAPPLLGTPSLATLAPPLLGTPLPNPGVLGLQSPSALQLFILPSNSTAAIPITNVFGLNFVVPAGVPAGTAELYWSLNGGPYSFIDVTVAQNNFELVTISNLASPARPGQTISFDGSGLGYGTPVSASVGGQPAQVIYAGRGNSAGHDQIQVQIPATAQAGCYVPLTLTYGQSSLTTSMSITADGSPCSHPFGLSVNDLKSLDAGGSVAIAPLYVSTTFDATTPSAVHRDESVSILPYAFAASDLAGIFISNATAGCAVALPAYAIYDVLALDQPPDLGAPLVLRGPAGGNDYPNLPPPVDGALANPPAPALAAGKWALITPGSADLTPFEFDFTLPRPFEIDGPVPVSFPRASDRSVTWDGSNFNANATVSLRLSGRASDGKTLAIVCNGPADTGTLTIPASFLGNFAPKSIGSLDVQIVSDGRIPQHATVQTKLGNTLVLYLSYSTDDQRPVEFQ
ncbi:MAG: hypothetical protein KGN84_19945, partial [Acidobacteriota bacterium]|nr:hypothetical protein [Acidobacteriota bacterium]